MIDFDTVMADLRGAVPEGWYLNDPTYDREFDPRPGYPVERYSVRATCGRGVGSRPRFYVGGSGQVDVGRRVEVNVSAGSLEGLVAAVRRLPALEFIFELAVDTEINVDTYDL